MHVLNKQDNFSKSFYKNYKHMCLITRVYGNIDHPSHSYIVNDYFTCSIYGTTQFKLDIYMHMARKFLDKFLVPLTSFM